jgi:hypothetical protein
MSSDPFTTDRWEQRRPRFIRWAKLAGLITSALTAEVISTDGNAAWLYVPRGIQSYVDLAWYLALIALLITGGVLLGMWLIGRFGDPPR